MKQKAFCIIGAIAAGVFAFAVYFSAEKSIITNELLLANVEALADSSEGSQSDCNTYCMVSYFDTCIIRYTNNTFTTCYDSRIRRSN